MTDHKKSQPVNGPCPGCGAPQGYPEAGPCLWHGTRYAKAVTGWQGGGIMGRKRPAR